jgi:hypothetical protein
MWDGVAFTYAVYHIPLELWTQLLPRKDNQIQFAELAGVLLAWATFRKEIAGNVWSTFQDNQAVERALLKATGGSQEVNTAVGRLWLEIADTGTAFAVWRVESAANVADAPSRQSFYQLRTLLATQVPAVMPPWALDLWSKQQSPA